MTWIRHNLGHPTPLPPSEKLCMGFGNTLSELVSIDLNGDTVEALVLNVVSG